MIVEALAFKRLRDNKSPVILYFVSSIIMGILLENLVVISFSSNFYSYPKFYSATSLIFWSYHGYHRFPNANNIPVCFVNFHVHPA